MSATRCSRCTGDLQHLVSDDPLNNEANFSCEKCSNMQKASQIRTGNMTIANELKELDRSKLENLTGFLSQYEPILGPSNAHVVEIKYAIVALLANRPPYDLENLSKEELELKAALATQLLELAEQVEPGSSRWRGQLLLELQMAQVALAAGLEETGAIGKMAARERAEEAMANLQEGARILQVNMTISNGVSPQLCQLSFLPSPILDHWPGGAGHEGGGAGAPLRCLHPPRQVGGVKRLLQIYIVRFDSSGFYMRLLMAHSKNSSSS